MAQEKIVYPPLSSDLQGGLKWGALKYFGAGAIMASVTIGSGETLFASRSGAVFGYTLLWCFIGGALMKGVQVYVGGRHMVLTGEHPMAHWAQLPGPRNWVPIVIGIAQYWQLSVLACWLADDVGAVHQLDFWHRRASARHDTNGYARTNRFAS